MDDRDASTTWLLIRHELRRLKERGRISPVDLERVVEAIEAEERELLAESGAPASPSPERIESVLDGLRQLGEVGRVSPAVLDRAIQSYARGIITDLRSASTTSRERDRSDVVEASLTVQELQRRRGEIYQSAEWAFFCESKFKELFAIRAISLDEHTKLDELYKRRREDIARQVVSVCEQSPWEARRAVLHQLVATEMEDLFERGNLRSAESEQAILVHFAVALTEMEASVPARDEFGVEDAAQPMEAMEREKAALFEELERAYLMGDQLSALVESQQIRESDRERLVEFSLGREADVAERIVRLRREPAAVQEQLDDARALIRELSVVSGCLRPETIDKLRRRFERSCEELLAQAARPAAPSEPSPPGIEEAHTEEEAEVIPASDETPVVAQAPVGHREPKVEVTAEPAPAQVAPAPKVAVEESAPARPRVSVREMLVEFFLDEKTIKGMISLGVLLALAGFYIFLRVHIHRVIQNRYFQLAILLLVTSSAFASGCWVLLRTKQKAMGRGLLLAGSILVPMNFWFLVHSGILAPSGKEYMVGAICTALYAGTGFVLGELLFVYMGAITAIVTCFVAVYRLGGAAAFPSKYAIGLTFIALAYMAASHAFRAWERMRQKRFDVPFYIISHVVTLVCLLFYTPLLVLLPPGFVRLLVEVDTVPVSIGLAIFISLSAVAIYLYSSVWRRERVWAYLFVLTVPYSIWLVLFEHDVSAWPTLLYFAFCALAYKVVSPLLRQPASDLSDRSGRVQILSAPLQHVGEGLNWTVLCVAGFATSYQIAQAGFDFTVASWYAIGALTVVGAAFGADVAIRRRTADVCLCSATLFVSLLLTLHKAAVPLHTQMPLLVAYLIGLRAAGACLSGRGERWAFARRPTITLAVAGVVVHLACAALRWRYFCIDHAHAGVALCLSYFVFMLVSLYLDRRPLYSHASLLSLTAAYVLFLYGHGLSGEHFPLALNVAGVIMVLPVFVRAVLRGGGGECYQRLIALPTTRFTIAMVTVGLAGWAAFAPDDLAAIPIRLIAAALVAAVHFGMIAWAEGSRTCSHLAVGLVAAGFNLVLLRNSDLIGRHAPLSWFHFPLFAVPFSYALSAVSVLLHRMHRLTSSQDTTGIGPPYRLFARALYNVSQSMCIAYLSICLMQWRFFLAQDRASWSVAVAGIFTAFYAASVYHFREVAYSYLSAATATATFLLTLLWADLASTWYPLAMMIWCVVGMALGIRYRDNRLIATPTKWVADIVSFVAFSAGVVLLLLHDAGRLDVSHQQIHLGVTLSLVLFSSYHLTRTILFSGAAYPFIALASVYVPLFVVLHWAGVDYAYYLCAGMVLSFAGSLVGDHLIRPGTHLSERVMPASRTVHQWYSLGAFFFYLIVAAGSLLPRDGGVIDTQSRAVLFGLMLAAVHGRYLSWSQGKETYGAVSKFAVAALLVYALPRLEYFCAAEPYAGAALCVFYGVFMLVSLHLERKVFFSYGALAFFTAAYLLLLSGLGARTAHLPLAMVIEAVLLVTPLFVRAIRRGQEAGTLMTLVVDPIISFSMFIVAAALVVWASFAGNDLMRVPVRLVIASSAAAASFAMMACMRSSQACSHIAVGLIAAAFNLVLLRSSDLVPAAGSLRWFHFPLLAIPFGYLMAALATSRVKDAIVAHGGAFIAEQAGEAEPGAGMSVTYDLLARPCYNISQAMAGIYLGICLIAWPFFLIQSNAPRSVAIAFVFAVFYGLSALHFGHLVHSYIAALAASATFVLALFWIGLGATWYPLAIMAWCCVGLMLGVSCRGRRLVCDPATRVADGLSAVALLSGVILFLLCAGGRLWASHHESHLAITLGFVLFSGYHLARAILHREVVHSFIALTSLYLPVFVVLHWLRIDYAYYLCGGMALSLVGTLRYDYLRRVGSRIGERISLASQIVYQGFSCVALSAYLIMGAISLMPGAVSSDSVSRAVVWGFVIGFAHSGYLAWSLAKDLYGYVSMFCAMAALFFGLAMADLDYYQIPCILGLHPLLCMVAALCLQRARHGSGREDDQKFGGMLTAVLPQYAQCVSPFIIALQLVAWRDGPSYHGYAMATAIETALVYGLLAWTGGRRGFSYMCFGLLAGAFFSLLEWSQLVSRDAYGLAYSLFVVGLTALAYVGRWQAGRAAQRGDDPAVVSAPDPIDLYVRPLFNSCALMLLAVAGGHAFFWRVYYPHNLSIMAYTNLVSAAVFVSFAVCRVKLDLFSREVSVCLAMGLTTFSYAALLRDWGVPNEWFALCFIVLGVIDFALGGYFIRTHSPGIGMMLFRKGHIITAISAGLSVFYPTEAAWVFLICSVLYGFDAVMMRICGGAEAVDGTHKSDSAWVSGGCLIASYFFLGRALEVGTKYYGLWAVGFPAILLTVSAGARRMHVDVLFRPYLWLGRKTYAIAAVANLWLGLMVCPDEGASMIAMVAMMCLSLAACRTFGIRGYFNMAIVFAFSEYWLFGRWLGLSLIDHTEYYSIPAGMACLAMGWLQIRGKTSSVMARVSNIGDRLAGRAGDDGADQLTETRAATLFGTVPYGVFLWAGSLLIAAPMFYHSVDPARRLQTWYVFGIFATAILLMGWGRLMQWKAPLYTGIAAFAGRLIVLVIVDVRWGGGWLWLGLGLLGAALVGFGWLLGYKRETLLAWSEELKARRDEVLEDLGKWK